MHPDISVILPFFNATSTLEEAVRSIQAQSLQEWELVAVDDGSTDGSLSLMEELARTDSRIRVFSRSHQGVTAAMNGGISAARGDYLARMDADDISHPRRLEVQKEYLEQHPSVELVGCVVELFPADRITEGMRHYLEWQNRCLTSEEIAAAMYREQPLPNPSLMFRRSVLRHGLFREGPFPEDYEFQLRLHAAGAVMARCPERLLFWREGEGRLTRTDPRYSLEAFDSIRYSYLVQDPRLQSGRPLLFWGAGRASRRRSDRLRKEGIHPAAYLDVDPRKIGGEHAGVPVLSPEEMDSFPNPLVLSFVRNHGAADAIEQFLQMRGRRAGRDYLLVGQVLLFFVFGFYGIHPLINM